jgi:hypothetical protein
MAFVFQHTDPHTGAAFPSAYGRVTDLALDFAGSSALVCVRVWPDEAARRAGKRPLPPEMGGAINLQIHNWTAVVREPAQAEGEENRVTETPHSDFNTYLAPAVSGECDVREAVYAYLKAERADLFGDAEDA